MCGGHIVFGNRNRDMMSRIIEMNYCLKWYLNTLLLGVVQSGHEIIEIKRQFEVMVGGHIAFGSLGMRSNPYHFCRFSFGWMLRITYNNYFYECRSVSGTSISYSWVGVLRHNCQVLMNLPAGGVAVFNSRFVPLPVPQYSWMWDHFLLCFFCGTQESAYLQSRRCLLCTAN